MSNKCWEAIVELTGESEACVIAELLDMQYEVIRRYRAGNSIPNEMVCKKMGEYWDFDWKELWLRSR